MGAPWQIAIPSYNRQGCLQKKTLAYLFSSGIEAERITVFVADRGQQHTYRAALPSAVKVHMAVPGIAGARNFIHRAYPAGTRLLCMDDDIGALHERLSDKKHAPVSDFSAVVDNGFDLCRRFSTRIWGVAPVLNPFFMRWECTLSLRFLVGCFYGVVVSHEDELLTTLEDKEDYERTLRYYCADRRVLRLNWLAPKTKYYTEPGGLQGIRTAAQSKRCAAELVRRYPGLVHARADRAGFAQIQLRDRNAD